MPIPVNRFSHQVAALVATLKRTAPTMGKVRIAQTLARAGLHLAPLTVMRMLRRDVPTPRPPSPSESPDIDLRPPSGRTVIATRANHVWGVDITTFDKRARAARELIIVELNAAQRLRRVVGSWTREGVAGEVCAAEGVGISSRDARPTSPRAGSGFWGVFVRFSAQRLGEPLQRGFLTAVLPAVSSLSALVAR
jgi:hypothetical protein